MPLIGLCFDGETPLLIMPFMSKGSVLEYVKQNKVDLHKDLESSEVEVFTMEVYVLYCLQTYCYVSAVFIQSNQDNSLMSS